MADNTQLFKGGNAPVGGGSAAPTKTTVTTSAPAGAGSILAIMKTVKTASNLSAEGKEYINKIESAVKSAGIEATMTRVAGANYEGYALAALDKVFGFVMLETLQITGDGLPAAASINDFRNALTRLRNPAFDPEKLEQFILVSKPQYEFADTMSSFIINYLAAETDSTIKHLSIAAFKDNVFKVTTDQDRVMSYIRACWPVDVLPRHDVAFLIYGTMPIQGQIGADGKQAVEAIPLVAVTGYTEFVYAKAGSMFATELRHAPVFVITGVYSRLPSSRLTALGLAASATVFVTNGQWLEPYSRYTKGSPDIGNLARDENGKLFTVQDLTGRNNILNNYLVTKAPRLALDVQLGQPLMPGLKDIFSNPSKFNAEIDNFTGGKGASSSRCITQLARRRFDGICKITKGGVAEEVDTRVIDPLYLIGQGVDPGEVADLYRLVIDNDPMVDASKRAEIVKRFVPGAQMRFITTRTVLEPEWVCNITNDMNKTIMLDVDGNFAETTYDVSNIRGFDLDTLGAMPMFNSGLSQAGLWSSAGNFGF